MAAACCVLVGLVLVLVPGDTTTVSTALLVSLGSGLLMLVAATLLYLQWRLAAGTGLGWLVIAVVLGSLQNLAAAGLAYVDRDAPRIAWSGLTDLAVGLALLALVSMRRRPPSVPDPLVLGLVAGLVFAAVRAAATTLPDHLVSSDSGRIVLAGLLVAVHAAGAVVLAHHRDLPAWARPRFAGVALFLGLSSAARPAPIEGPWPWIVAASAAVGAALLLTEASLLFLRHSLVAQQANTERLHRSLRETQSSSRADRERLHEIRSTVAGIANAEDLIHEHVVDDASRVRLEAAIHSELARLDRLLDRREPSDPEPVDLDATLDPVLEAHRARGHRIAAEPFGEVVSGRADDVAEVVNILLENAALHAQDSESRIQVSRSNGQVVIAVTDSGPGIPAEDRDKVFEWGVRGGESSGQGIGLHVARRLVTEQGGTLTIDDRRPTGTTFLIHLPAARAQPARGDPADQTENDRGDGRKEQP